MAARSHCSKLRKPVICTYIASNKLRCEINIVRCRFDQYKIKLTTFCVNFVIFGCHAKYIIRINKPCTRPPMFFYTDERKYTIFNSE